MKKLLAATVVGAVLLGGVGHASTAADPHRYVLRGVDPDPWPGVIVFRHCGSATEDSMAHLRMVRYLPGEKIVYRCRAAGY